MTTRTRQGLTPALLMAAAALHLSTVHAGQVQVTINGSPGSLCCGTVTAPQAYERTYNHSFMYAPLQFAYEGASVSADLATGLIKGSSYASGSTGVFWLSGMSEEFRITRPLAGPGEFINVGLSVRVEADPEWQTTGDFFESIQSTARLEFGRATLFGLSEVTTAQWRHIWSRDTSGLGGTESYVTIPTGNVTIESASENFFDITLNATKSIFIGDGATESALFGFNFFLNADIYANLGGGVSFDASHTARVMLSLPPGFELASASGVFLTQPVPLPASLGLLGAASSLILVRFRRSSSKGARRKDNDRGRTRLTSCLA
jgi:hypothetical protein